MPIRDNVSDQKVQLLMLSAIATNAATNSGVLDTKDYDFGVTIAAFLAAFTDGSFALSVFESENADFSNANAVNASNIIETVPTLATAVAAVGDANEVFGVVNTKRYIRVTVTSTGVTAGATVVMNAVMRGNTGPQERTAK